MMKTQGLYRGEVVHARVRPVSHKLRYKVFSLLVDVERLEALGRRLKLLGINRPGIFSIHDSDHGEGGALLPWLRKIAGRAGEGEKIERFLMLAYPRVLGIVFNPITVYYGLDAGGAPRLMIYEVSNTFGERMTYVLPVERRREDGLIVQSTAKRLFVSPFNDVEGDYLFHVTEPGEALTLGVALKTDEGPLLRAHFRARHRELTDANLAKALATYGWMTVTIIAGIHWEALKLWLKGLRLKRRPAPPSPPVVSPHASTPNRI